MKSYSFAICFFCKMKKKLENICDFAWWYEIFFVTLHRHLRLVAQTQGRPRGGLFLR